MKYAGIIYNDFSAAPGICLSFFTQGCPHRCKGCHNQETWDFNGGREFTNETLSSIIKGLTANNINRHLAILGGEPLCSQNILLTWDIIQEVKKHLPNTKIYLWTGYTYEEIQDYCRTSIALRSILKSIDFLIDGPYIEDMRDITLQMRGSSNQRIINLKTAEVIEGSNFTKSEQETYMKILTQNSKDSGMNLGEIMNDRGIES